MKASGIILADAQKSLEQALNPADIKNVPLALDKTPTYTRSAGRGGMVTGGGDVLGQYDQYREFKGAGGRAGSVPTGYSIPTQQTYKNVPLVAKYDIDGNFQYMTFPEDKYLNIDPNDSSIISQPKINANGEIIDDGIAKQGDPFSGGMFGGFIDSFKDLSPLLLTGLGANLFGGMNLLGRAGELAGATGASAADIAASNALANANMANYAGLASDAGISMAGVAPGTAASHLLAQANLQYGGASPIDYNSVSKATPASYGSVAGTPLDQIAATAPVTTPSVTPETPLSSLGESPVTPDISGAMSAGQTPYDVAPDITAATVGQMPSAGSSLSNLLPNSLKDLLPTTPAGMGALLSGVGNVASGLIGGNAAQKAAQIQANAATRAAQMQQDMFNTVNAQGAPYRAQGYNALDQIGSMLPGQYTQYDATGEPTGRATGSGYLTQQFGPDQFAAGMDPGYAFRLQQGQLANQRASNLAGGLIGGNALKGMQDYTQGMASQEYGNAFNRFQTQRGNIYNTLAGIAGIGQTAQGQANQMAQNNATAQGQLGVGSAAAGAAGQIGQANAYGGALTGAGNAYLLSQLLKQNQGVALPPP